MKFEITIKGLATHKREEETVVKLRLAQLVCPGLGRPAPLLRPNVLRLSLKRAIL